MELCEEKLLISGYIYDTLRSGKKDFAAMISDF